MPRIEKDTGGLGEFKDHRVGSSATFNLVGAKGHTGYPAKSKEEARRASALRERGRPVSQGNSRTENLGVVCLSLQHPGCHRPLQQINAKRGAPGNKDKKLPMGGEQHIIRQNTLKSRRLRPTLDPSSHQQGFVEENSNMVGESFNIRGRGSSVFSFNFDVLVSSWAFDFKTVSRGCIDQKESPPP